MDLGTLNASDGTGEASQASVQAIRTAGANSITVSSLSHWPAKFIATTGTLIPVQGTNQKTIDPSTMLVFAGHISAGKIVIDSVAPGYVDQGSKVNDVVIIKPTTFWADILAGAVQSVSGNGTPVPATFSTLTTTSNTTIQGNLVVNGTSSVKSGSVTSAATINPTAQVYNVTALAVPATINIPSIGAADGLAFLLRIKDNGTAQALTFSSSWGNVSGLATPTTTTAGKQLTIGALYNSSTSRWEIQGINVGA